LRSEPSPHSVTSLIWGTVRHRWRDDVGRRPRSGTHGIAGIESDLRRDGNSACQSCGGAVSCFSTGNDPALLIAAAAILGGIALVVVVRPQAR
jgi:hypothetical protein